MEKLHSGEFFGRTDQKLDSGGLILTNTAYTHDYVDWHHHENAYFTFIITGKVIEGNKKGRINLAAGHLLYHNAQESHYNIKPKGETRGMHVELHAHWMEDNYSAFQVKEGSFQVTHPKTKLLFYKLLKESQMGDDLTTLGVQHLVIEAMDSLHLIHTDSIFRPSWINQVIELLQDNYRCTPDLKTIAAVVGVHAVHLSRSFSKYFGCTMAEYIRQLKVDRALSQLGNTNISLGELAYQSGFADQSHMIRCFKEHSDGTPSFYRKLINS
jgi:AraC family transcriptional regulator